MLWLYRSCFHCLEALLAALWALLRGELPQGWPWRALLLLVALLLAALCVVGGNDAVAHGLQLVK